MSDEAMVPSETEVHSPGVIQGAPPDDGDQDDDGEGDVQ